MVFVKKKRLAKNTENIICWKIVKGGGGGVKAKPISSPALEYTNGLVTVDSCR